jgi:ribulose-phosphate 3-epimerase
VIDQTMWIGPSILTADFLELGEQIARAEAAGVDFIHLDVMDGRFVPNISFGFPIIEAVRRKTALPLDVHLMIDEPERYVTEFVSAGADTVTIQVEACVHLHRTVLQIQEAGATPGIALCPGTPLGSIEELIPFVGNLLIMTVNPGFGGQSFIPSMLDKIARARGLIDAINPACRLEVDGGVKPTNIKRILNAGADTFVVGSSIFDGSDDVTANVAAIRSALESPENQEPTRSE